MVTSSVRTRRRSSRSGGTGRGGGSGREEAGAWAGRRVPGKEGDSGRVTEAGEEARKRERAFLQPPDPPIPDPGSPGAPRCPGPARWPPHLSRLRVVASRPEPGSPQSDGLGG